MTALQADLVARIGRTGPMTVAQYMETCLNHPDHGYYATRDPLGAEGDFTTAPEVSQMFGECIGLALVQAWLDAGSPAPFALVELGPGRGTLMADILRAARLVPAFGDAAEVHLVETSRPLRAAQAEALGRDGVQWHDTFGDVPDLPLYLVANEFFDALPIRQFVRSGAGWCERMVGVRDGALTFGLGPVTAFEALAHRLDDTRDGDLVETCAPARSIAAGIGARIAAHGGTAIIIDYGDWRSLGDTFQAVRGHQTVDPLSEPGESDLTAHVDFEDLAGAVSPAAHSRLVTQAGLLNRLGIGARAEALAKSLSGAALENHLAAYQRLTSAQEMGTLFKALAVFPAGRAAPPGFET